MRITKVIVCFVKSTLRKARSLCSVDLIFCPKYGMAIAKRRKLRYDNLCASAALHRGAETQNRGSKRFRKRSPFFHKRFTACSKPFRATRSCAGAIGEDFAREFPGYIFPSRRERMVIKHDRGQKPHEALRYKYRAEQCQLHG